MIRKFVTGVVVCALVCLTLIGTLSGEGQKVDAKPRKHAGEKQFRHNGLIIKPKRGASQQSIRALHASLGVGVSARFDELGNMEVLDLPPGLDVVQAMDRYTRHPLIEYAEPDYIVTVSQNSPQFVPNDLVSNLWGLNNTGQTGGKVDADIDAPEAWDIRTDASSVVVGVIDTGVDYNHPDLAANMWRNVGETAGDGIDNDSNGYIDDVYGINGITNSGNPMDDHYHGTHVAGTIGGVGNNGIGVVGVAPNVKLMALKFLSSSGSGNTSDAIKCINYGRQMGAHILSNSWGGGGYSQALFDAISSANTAGVLFVAAAGNSNVDNDAGEYYPANYNVPNVVAVASTDHNDNRSGFSQYGYRKVLLGAPGSNIYSTYPNNSYNTISGTSMATPHVSGAFALVKAHRPDLDSVTKLIQHLAMATDSTTAMSSVTFTGGRLNLHNALAGNLRAIAHLSADKKSIGPGESITFTDSSIGSNITSRTIDYGDGTVEPINGTAQHVFANSGNYNVTLKVVSGGVEYTRSLAVAVRLNYSSAPDTYGWVSTTGMTSVALADDSASGVITLPFTFRLYGADYTTLYIGSNGLITLGSTSGSTSYANAALPSTAAPNAALYPYWDDLNPAGGGAIRHGSFPGGYVVSFEGVPHFSDTASPLTFQLQIYQNGDIEFHYQDIRPTSAYGAGKSATVGIEDGPGTTAKQHSLNGSPLLTNLSAIKFSPAAASGPQAPSNLTATAASTSQINLAWADNSADETGFEVEASTNGGSTFNLLASVAAGVTTYSHTGLTAGSSRHYRVRAKNAAGNSSYTNTASAVTPSVPAAPSNLTAIAASGSQINLSWTDNSSNETGFGLEVSTDNVSFTALASPGSNVTSYQHTGLSAGSLRYYRVRAVNGTGNSSYSAVASATTVSVPSAPSALAASAASTSQINLSWSDNSTNEDGFDVEVSSDGANFSALASTTANVVSYAHTGLAAGSQRHYRVRAKNSAGNSAYTAVATATTSQPPAAPQSLVATAASTTQINLSWVDASSNETGFKVEMSSNGGTSFTQLGSVGEGVTSFQHSGLTAGTTRHYRVVATNLNGDSAASNIAVATTFAPPAQPSGLTATATGPNSITVTWTNVSDETGYVLEVSSPTAGFAPVQSSLGPDVTSFNHTGLTEGTLYNYRIKAVNSYGESGYSSTASATTPWSAPAAPLLLSATAISGTQVNLNWTDNSTNETGFRIERALGSGSYSTVATVAPETTNYQDSGLVSGTNYRYRIVAVNNTAASVPSNEVSLITLAPPTTPSNLRVTGVNRTSISLAWDRVANASGYVVQRLSGKTWIAVTSTTLPITEPVFTDTGLLSRTRYTYRVYAVNAVGASAPTVSVSGTTLR